MGRRGLQPCDPVRGVSEGHLHNIVGVPFVRPLQGIAGIIQGVALDRNPLTLANSHSYVNKFNPNGIAIPGGTLQGVPPGEQ